METTSAAPADSGSIDTSQGDSSSSDTAETSQQAAPSFKERFKLKVDGEDIEQELDWNDKEGITKQLQLAAAAKKRMGEASEAKKKAFEIVRQFEENPESMLARLGPRGREIAEKYLLGQLQEEMLSPEEKEYRNTKAELEKFRKEKLDREEGEKKSISERREAEYAQNFQSTIISALDKSGLPKTPEMVKRMAGIMKANLQHGLELTPEDLVSEVKSDITKIVKSIIGDSDGDHLINLFGEDIANKIRKSDLKKLQEKQSSIFSGSRRPASAPAAPRDDKRPLSIEEWKEQVNQRIRD